MGIIMTTEVTITKIGVNRLNRLSLWTSEYEAPFRLKTINPNYNDIYNTIKIGEAYRITYKYNSIQSELLSINNVKIKTIKTSIRNHCPLYREFKWLNEYTEILVKNSRKRFVIKTILINQLPIGNHVHFNYIKLYSNLYEIQQVIY